MRLHLKGLRLLKNKKVFKHPHLFKRILTILKGVSEDTPFDYSTLINVIEISWVRC